MASNLRKQQIDANYDYFQRTLALLLPEHEGQYVLLKNGAVIDFFDRPGEAYRSGIERFPDRIFSIQEVTAEPLELGFFSYAGT